MERWLSNIIFSIPLSTLDNTLKEIPYSYISGITPNSTANIVKFILQHIDDIDIKYNTSARTIIIELYGISLTEQQKIITGISITSCLSIEQITLIFQDFLEKAT